MPRLPYYTAVHVRQAITALRDVLADLDNMSHAEEANFAGVAVLENVRDRGLEPIVGYLSEALLGAHVDDDDDDDEEA